MRLCRNYRKKSVFNLKRHLSFRKVTTIMYQVLAVVLFFFLLPCAQVQKEQTLKADSDPLHLVCLKQTRDFVFLNKRCEYKHANSDSNQMTFQVWIHTKAGFYSLHSVCADSTQNILWIHCWTFTTHYEPWFCSKTDSHWTS